MPELITLEEVAQYLRVTEKTIYRLLEQGKIPATKVGRLWRFDRAGIDDWLKRRSVGLKPRILVVDDEETVQLLFKEALGNSRHEVVTVGSGEGGLEQVKQKDFDLVFLDLKMPGMDGVELFTHIKSLKPSLTVVIITGYPDSELMAQALDQGPFAVMKKPFNVTDIINATNNFLRLRT